MANFNDSIPSACEKCGKDFSRPRDPLVSAEPRAESRTVCDECKRTPSADKAYLLVPSAESDGTHGYDEIAISPAAVVRCFGHGNQGDGYKVSRQWVFRKGDLVFTLYDWKATKLYDGKMWSPEGLWACPEEFDLHVGSKEPATERDVAEFIDFVKRATSPAERSCFQCHRPAVPGDGRCRCCILEHEASEAFWAVIAGHFPEAKYGDLSPERTIRQCMANVDAIDEWIRNNAMPQDGDEDEA